MGTIGPAGPGVHATVGSLQKLWWCVPGCLNSLCHSLKGSGLSSSGAQCLLTALLGCWQLPSCLSPSRHLIQGNRGNSSWRFFLPAIPHQRLQEGLETQKSAEIHLDALAACKRPQGPFRALLCPDNSSAELIPGGCSAFSGAVAGKAEASWVHAAGERRHRRASPHIVFLFT